MRTSSARQVLCGSSRTVTTCSVAVLAVGIFWLFLIGITFHYDGFEDMKQMLDVEENVGNNDFGSVGLALNVSAFAALFAVTLGVIGCVGNHLEGKGAMCCFLLSTAILSVIFFAIATYSYLLVSNVVPLAEQQTSEFCHLTFNFAYETKLKCNDNAKLFQGGSKVEETSESWLFGETGCGQECADRIALIRTLGGCKYLEALCHKYNYDLVGDGKCQLEKADGSLFLPPVVPNDKSSPMTQECCQAACDAVASCAGFTHEEATSRCLLLAPHRPFTELPAVCGDKAEWETRFTGKESLSHWKGDKPGSSEMPEIKASDGSKGAVCFAKEKDSKLLQAIRSTTSYLLILSVVATVVFCLASVFACCMQYTLVTRRKGRKGPGALISRMLSQACGMCHKNGTEGTSRNSEAKQQILDSVDSEEEEDEDSDED